MAQPPVEPSGLETRCRGWPSFAPGTHLVEAQQLANAERPGAQEEREPAAGEQQQQRMAVGSIVETPDVSGNGLPAQDQRKEGQVGHMYIGTLFKRIGQPSHEPLLEPRASHY